MDLVTELIGNASTVVARKYARYGMARDDIRSEMWIWALKHKPKLVEYLHRPEESRRQQRAGKAAAYKSLLRAGERWCRREKARICGYQTHDEAFYDDQKVMQWLAVIVNGQSALATQSFDQVRTRRTLSEGWNLEASIADVDRALKSLPMDERRLVLALYGEGATVREVAAAMDLAPSTVEGRAHRALSKMVDKLGGYSPYR